MFFSDAIDVQNLLSKESKSFPTPLPPSDAADHSSENRWWKTVFVKPSLWVRLFKTCFPKTISQTRVFQKRFSKDGLTKTVFPNRFSNKCVPKTVLPICFSKDCFSITVFSKTVFQNRFFRNAFPKTFFFPNCCSLTFVVQKLWDNFRPLVPRHHVEGPKETNERN